MWLEINEKEKRWLLENLPDCKESSHLKKKIEKVHKIKPRSAKNKGLDWQKEICSFIANIIGIEYNQKDDQCLIHSRESGLSGVDVILRGKAKDLYNYDIECKSCENIALNDWVDQAKKNSSLENNWLIFIKNRRVGKIVVMPLEGYKILLDKIFGGV